MQVYKVEIRFTHEEDGHNGKREFDPLFTTESAAKNYARPHLSDYHSTHSAANAFTIPVDVYESAAEAIGANNRAIIERAKKKLTQEEQEALRID